MLDALRRIKHDLTGRHRQVEEEVIVPGNERQNFGYGLLVEGGRSERHGRQLAEQEGRRRDVTVVHLVAHVHGLRHDRFQFEAAHRIDDGCQRWAHRTGHPAQSRQHVRAVGAEAQHFAQAFVHVAVGFAAAGRIAHDPDRHARADNASHRADGAVMVARIEFDCAGFDELPGGVEIFRPAFEQNRSEHCTLLRAAHVIPGNGRAGMENNLSVHAGHDLAGQLDADEDRLGGEIPSVSDFICFFDTRIVGKKRQIPGGFVIAARRRLPLQIGCRCAELADRIAEARQADIDDVQFFTDEIGHVGSPFDVFEDGAGQRHRFGIAGAQFDADFA